MQVVFPARMAACKSSIVASSRRKGWLSAVIGIPLRLRPVAYIEAAAMRPLSSRRGFALHGERAMPPESAMRRSYAIVLIVLLLAGCSGGGLEPLPTASVRAVFRPGDVRDVITVSAIDRLALRSAELVAPNGAATPADDINVERAPGFTGGQFPLN